MALASADSTPRVEENAESWPSRLQSLTSQPDRASLPALAKPLPSIQVWKVIKDAFGSSKLMSMPLPIQLHEPTTELMKRAEDLAYAELLNLVIWQHLHL